MDCKSLRLGTCKIHFFSRNSECTNTRHSHPEATCELLFFDGEHRNDESIGSGRGCPGN